MSVYNSVSDATILEANSPAVNFYLFRWTAEVNLLTRESCLNGTVVLIHQDHTSEGSY